MDSTEGSAKRKQEEGQETAFEWTPASSFGISEGL